LAIAESILFFSGGDQIVSEPTELPQRTITLKNQMTDTDRWDHFIPRDGDIFVAVPAKCGTTWTQAICALLIFQTPELKVKPASISPWFDMPMQPLEDVIALLEG